MAEPDEQSLRERIEALERQVATLQHDLRQISPRPAPNAPPLPNAPVGEPPPMPPPPVVRPPIRKAQKAPRDRADRLTSALKSEDWLNKIGIALLLIGLAFLFKFSIDQGWLTELLTPWVRIGFGLVLGAFLLGAGLRLRPTRQRYGQVLIGGGIATFYVTIFSAYQLYALVGYPTAFIGMGIVTLLAFVLAVQQNDAVLGVIATMGGLGTPFLLYTGDSNLSGLVIYTCIILTGSMGVYFYRGWRTLLWTSVVGGWLVFLVASFEFVSFFTATTSQVPFGTKVIYQLGVLYGWLLFGVLPVVRAVLHYRAAEAWHRPPLRFFKERAFVEEPALLLAILAPLITLALSRNVWTLSGTAWGVLIVAVAVLYGAGFVWLRREGVSKLASAHGVAAALLAALSVFDLFPSEIAQMVAFAVVAATVHGLAARLEDRGLRLTGHAFFSLIAVMMMARILDNGAHTPVLLNIDALADLAVIALGLSAAWTLKTGRLKAVYLMAAYVALLGWFWRDLVALPNGQAYISVAWGLCALVLLILGWWRDEDFTRNVGLGTLLVVVAKLFVVDLSKLDAVWRILLFLGFGGLLLLLSYFFPRLWRPEPEPETPSPPSEEAA
jgi:uncharacterized membrane protein